jgi:acetylglutamate kinase
MIPKVRNALESVEAGIEAVHVLDMAGLSTLTSPAPAGTVIVASPEDSRG